MIERRFSKAKANGNRVVFTTQEILHVPFFRPGVVFDGMELGVLRVPRRDMYCAGFRVDFVRPSGAAGVQFTSGLYTANGQPASPVLTLNGVVDGGEVNFNPGIPMPVNSLWKFRCGLVSDDEDFAPADITITYWLRFANGPVNTGLWSPTLPQEGIGLWGVTDDFVVTP